MNDRVQKRQRRLTETAEERQNQISRENECKYKLRSQRETYQTSIENLSDNKTSREITQKNKNNFNLQSISLSANIINEKERILLQKFCNKIDNIQYNTYPICNK